MFKPNYFHFRRESLAAHPEPSLAADVATVRFQLPKGTKLSRRFHKTDSAEVTTMNTIMHRLLVHWPPLATLLLDLRSGYLNFSLCTFSKMEMKFEILQSVPTFRRWISATWRWQSKLWSESWIHPYHTVLLLLIDYFLCVYVCYECATVPSPQRYALCSRPRCVKSTLFRSLLIYNGLICMCVTGKEKRTGKRNVERRAFYMFSILLAG